MKECVESTRIDAEYQGVPWLGIRVEGHKKAIASIRHIHLSLRRSDAHWQYRGDAMERMAFVPQVLRRSCNQFETQTAVNIVNLTEHRGGEKQYRCCYTSLCSRISNLVVHLFASPRVTVNGCALLCWCSRTRSAGSGWEVVQYLLEPPW